MNNRIDAEYWRIIWTNFKAGDRDAFQTIYKEFVDALYSYGSRFTADRDLLKDAIQDLFIDIYTYGSNLRKPESLEFYLYISLKRISFRKLIEKNRYSSVQELQESFDLKFSVEEELFEGIHEESLYKLKDEIAHLSPQKRELLFLKFNSGLTFKEIEKIESRYLSTETVGCFTGVYLGLYATGNGKPSETNADYDWFEYVSN